MGKKNPKSWEIKYKYINQLGRGGNASVFLVENDSGDRFAVKQLENIRDNEKTSRFLDEIKVMSDNRSIPGIIPIIEENQEEYWYLMPVAETIMDHLEKSEDRLEEIKTALIDLTETMRIMQSNEISHRDIKPDNLYFLNGRYCFGDFGLVDFPDHTENLTDTYRNLGAKFTIAPEMMRNPKTADGKKADIYSMAKTIWMLLTKDELGFEGKYNPLDLSHALHNRDGLRNVHLAELDQLIQDATSNDPEDRPTIDIFIEKIKKWIQISKDEELSQESDWEFLAHNVFGSVIPKSAIWEKTEDIIHILNLLRSTPAYNHMLYPNGGGLDFDYACATDEEGWIDIVTDTGTINRVKPRWLNFEGFDNNKWNYFRLDLSEESYVFNEQSPNISFEFLVEDTPAHYVDATDYEYGVYDYDSGIPLPPDSKLLRRYIKGTFLFVMKSGPYNKIDATYDGRHGDCSKEVFREYIEELIKVSKYCESKGFDDEIILNSSKFVNNPFIKTEEEIKAEERQYRRENRKKVNEFIDTELRGWRFPVDCTKAAKYEKSRILYYFKVKNEDIFSLSFDDIAVKQVIGNDGYVREIIEEKVSDNTFYVDSRDLAIEFVNEINNLIEKKVLEAGFEIPNEGIRSFEIEFVRGGIAPDHLFTREEIEREMMSADDRFDNVLVIDENGYPHVIQNEKEKRMLYPVRTESWDARNRYVGKYSDLSDAGNAYLRVLDGWLMYLKTGTKIYRDYTSLKDDKNIIVEIMEFYKI